MKKIAVSSLLSMFVLAGCGGSDHSDSSKVDNDSSYLIVKGNGISETMKFDESKLEYTIVATGNQPISLGSFNAIGEVYPAFTNVEFNKDNKVKLTMAYTKAGINQAKLVICFPNFNCSSNSTYSITDLNQKKKIQVTLVDAPNQFYMGDSSHQITDLSELKNVTVSGKLNYYSESNWPIFQSNRFPAIPIQGKIIFDKDEYQIQRYEEVDSTYENQVLRTERSLILKNGDKSIFLTIIKTYNTTSENDIAIVISTDTDTYRITDLPNEIWSTSTQGLQLNLNSLELKNSNDQMKILSSNAFVPFDQSNLILNNMNKLSLINSNVQAYTRNDQKLYELGFKEQGNLTIIQEFKGHLSATLTQGETTYHCGDRNTACTGLTVDNSKQNFTFNNVKIGSNTINGTYYFAGVFE
ncbi:hypothetical protein EXE10_13885 [Acinetobacter sp. WCHAc060033]|uniref:hypothetical protein n=1 Tax=Acinetobacter sp. WCHAc060033 TaxID=2518624 RepID=UPI0010238BB6|nr:hypothetical protein [Acinetobacter sp. WCHAc060033]RZG80650.1 hypothetical protein EXE10_13885 [Acinetobacter sp. WCHAc060033]